MPSVALRSWLIVNMLRELVSHVAPPANTSGPSLLVLMNKILNLSLTCPCVAGSTNGNNIPSFVGQNCFCETGITQLPGFLNTFWPNGDPLWDGQECGPTSSCCTFNSPPWFNVRLPNATTDYIEVRICSSGIYLEDTPIQLMELYVKWTEHNVIASVVKFSNCYFVISLSTFTQDYY